MGILFAVFAILTFVDASYAQMKVRVNWSAIAAGQSGIWIAHDEGLFRKNGLEVELLHIPSSSRIIQTMLAGEIAISYVDGRNAIQSNLTGSDVALIAGVTNRFSFSMMARPEIKRVSDLKGKRIGVTRVGSSTHTAALYALNQAGLKPGDYDILPLAEVPNILVALMAGRIDAGPLSSPTTIRARKAGMVELAALAKDGPEYVSVAVGTTRAYIRANEEIVRRFIALLRRSRAPFQNQQGDRHQGPAEIHPSHRLGNPRRNPQRIPRLYRIGSLRKPQRRRSDSSGISRERSQGPPG